MAKIILAINAGSSSVKISVYRADRGQEPAELAETQIDGLTSPPPKLKYSRAGKSICKDKVLDQKISSQKEAVEFLLDLFKSNPALYNKYYQETETAKYNKRKEYLVWFNKEF